MNASGGGGGGAGANESGEINPARPMNIDGLEGKKRGSFAAFSPPNKQTNALHYKIYLLCSMWQSVCWWHHHQPASLPKLPSKLSPPLKLFPL